MSNRVVIIGAGFAGQHAYDELARAGYDVTLIDRHPYATFQPLLYQVATGGLNPGDIAYPLRRFVSAHPKRSARFRRATVTGIDTENKLVHTSKGNPIPYDKLVLTAGAGPNFFGIPGAKEHARTIYSRAEALAVRDLIFSQLERMTTGGTPEDRFTVLVVGGGATGVEMAGTLAELKSEAIPVVYPELSQDSLRVVLAEMGPSLLGPFAPKLQRYTLQQLRKRGVDVRLNTAVKEITPTSVKFEDSSLDVDLVIWASGFGAHPEVADWGMPQGRGGRIEIEPDLRVKGFDDVYAAGDVAVDPEDPLPQLAQPAIQMGRHVARQIIAVDMGEGRTPFSYHDKGTMATIGRNAAVVQLPNGRTFTGFPAWAMWVVVHLATLLGGRNRIQAMINTGFRYLAWPKSATNIVGDAIEAVPLPARTSEDREDDGA